MVRGILIPLLSAGVLLALPSPGHAAGDPETCHQWAVGAGGQLPVAQFFESDCAQGKREDIDLFCENLVTRQLPFDPLNQSIQYFIKAKAVCGAPRYRPAFCGFVRSFDGYKRLKEDEQAQKETGLMVPDTDDPDYAALTHFRARAAQLCGATVEAIHAELCAKADAEHRWDFAEAECPAEIKVIHARECPANRKKYFDGEGGNSVGVDRKILEKSAWCYQLDALVAKPH